MSARPNPEPSDDETLTDTEGSSRSGAPAIAAPYLFVALECDRPSAGVARHSLANVDRVTIGRSRTREAERAFEKEDAARVLVLGIPDRRLSLRHAHLVHDGGLFFIADLDSRNGTRVNGRPVEGSTSLADGDLIQVGHTFLRFRAASPVSLNERADVDSSTWDRNRPFETIDPALAGRGAALERVARSASSVLVFGETGTGKEVLAQAIHRLSGRKGAFVAVNCGALPTALVESQLFGHVRGAFSGAVEDARGLVRASDHGTLFLDEIGDLPHVAQPALLRVLQEQEVVPVGGTAPIKVDLRVVAATHRPLEDLVAQGAFRNDLFARLAAFTFSLPPLRERPDDIGLLVAALLRGRPIRFTTAAGRALLEHRWRLNVRELSHVLDVASTLSHEHAIDLQDLPAAIRESVPPARKARPPAARDPLRQRLIDSLRSHDGNVTEVARELGKARMQVQRWMKRFGIDSRSFRGP